MMPADAPTTITLLQTNSLTMAVQQEVERAILAGEYVPGSKLNEAALALKLGVSRGPVREAFRMLDEAGLVRTEKNRGVFVRNIPIDEAIEIFELRATMEELVGRRLAASMAPEQQQEIEALVHAMEESVKNRDSHSYHLLNLQFHDALVDFAGNRKLSVLYRRLINELSLFRRMNLAAVGALPTSAGEHRAILKAIAGGDAAGAGAAMRQHVLDSKERTLRHQAAKPTPSKKAPAHA